MAFIHICDLKVRAIIGAHAWERINKQDLIVNLTIEYDASKASKTDQLKDALDYEALANKIIKTIERTKYQLLERLVAQLLDGLMRDKRVLSATVRLDKPHAIALARSVSFELSRQR